MSNAFEHGPRKKRTNVEPAAAWRLNWNPDRAPDDVTNAHVNECRETGSVTFNWRCGSANILDGQRVLLVRTGRRLRGIIGSGVAVGHRQGGTVDPDGNWEPYFVAIKLDRLALEPIVPRSALDVPPLDKVAWSVATAATRISEDQLRVLDALIAAADPHQKQSTEGEPLDFADQRNRQLRELINRQNQDPFRQALLDAYEGRCAITGCDVADALDAAHIHPYSGLASQRVDNGILLRADLHRLFDRKLIAIDTKEWRVVISPVLANSAYSSLRGLSLRRPLSAAARPRAELLDKHRLESGL